MPVAPIRYATLSGSPCVPIDAKAGPAVAGRMYKTGTGSKAGRRHGGLDYCSVKQELSTTASAAVVAPSGTQSHQELGLWL